MKKIFCLTLFIYSVSCRAQVQEVLRTERAILDAFEKNDSVKLQQLVDNQFFLVHADGLTDNRNTFLHSYDIFNLRNQVKISTEPGTVIDHGDIIILRGVAVNQWMEGDRMLRSKNRYTSTYNRKNNEWKLVSSFINDTGEPYYVLGDTTGIWRAIELQYARLDRTVEQKDLCTHFALKTNDFTTLDHLGNIGSASFMRTRSRALFELMRDSIHSFNKIEKIKLVGDTAKVTVLQSFKRKQMAGGQVRYLHTTARQRESWMLTREGWKLVFVDDVHPLTRIVDGIETDAQKPVNWNDPVFNKSRD
jgi:hypothetical protein